MTAKPLSCLQLTQSKADCIKVLCEFIKAKTINSNSLSPFPSCFVALTTDFLPPTVNPRRHYPDDQTYHINFIIRLPGGIWLLQTM